MVEGRQRVGEGEESRVGATVLVIIESANVWREVRVCNLFTLYFIYFLI